MTIEYIQSKDCCILSFNDAYTYVKECGGSVMEFVIAWISGRRVKGAACREYVLHKPETALGKRFTAVLSERSIESLNKEKDNLEQKCKSISLSVQTLSVNESNIKSEVSTLKDTLERSKEWIKQSNELFKDSKDALNKLKSKLIDLGQEKYEIITKTSAVAGDILNKNNPDITDLNDPYRPMKVAEDIGKIYDEEWTEAECEIEVFCRNNRPDKQKVDSEEIMKQTIEILLDALKEVDDRGKEYIKDKKNKMRNQKIDRLKEALNNESHDKEISQNNSELWKDEGEQIKEDLHKRYDILEEMVKSITNTLMKEKYSDVHPNCQFEKYLHAIAKQIILMNLHTPPVVFEWSVEGDAFDRNIQKEFTRTGSVVEFLVWPTLCIYKNGPLINKGVVQLKKEPSKDPES